MFFYNFQILCNVRFALKSKKKKKKKKKKTPLNGLDMRRLELSLGHV